jgi:flagellar basal-body rod protein FlgB
MSHDAVEQVTTRALTLALDAASLRHRVIAANIAHANTPGFMPQRVSFEALVSSGTSPPAGELRAQMEPAVPAGVLGGSVSVDAEVAALAENTLHQQVLLRALQRHLGLLAVAVNEGKR